MIVPHMPLPIVLIALLATPPTGDGKKDFVGGCWADGRTDILVLTDECPPPLPPLEEIPLWLSWYDSALCYDENGNIIVNINCNEDPAHMAGGTPVTEEMYGYAGACLPQWFDRQIWIEPIGLRHCLDTGGAVMPTYREIFYPGRGFVTLWVIPFDALEHYQEPPWWQYLPIEPDGWELVD